MERVGSRLSPAGRRGVFRAHRRVKGPSWLSHVPFLYLFWQNGPWYIPGCYSTRSEFYRRYKTLYNNHRRAGPSLASRSFKGTAAVWMWIFSPPCPYWMHSSPCAELQNITCLIFLPVDLRVNTLIYLHHLEPNFFSTLPLRFDRKLLQINYNCTGDEAGPRRQPRDSVSGARVTSSLTTDLMTQCRPAYRSAAEYGTESRKLMLKFVV